MDAGKRDAERKPDVVKDRANTLTGLLRPGAFQLYETRAETRVRVREMLVGQQRWLNVVLGVVALFMAPVFVATIWNVRFANPLVFFLGIFGMPFSPHFADAQLFAWGCFFMATVFLLYTLHWFVWGVRYTAIAYALEEIPVKKFWDAWPLLGWPFACILAVLLVRPLTARVETAWLWAYYFDTWYCSYLEGVIACIAYLPAWCVVSSFASVEGFIAAGCYRFQVLNTIMLRRSLWLRPRLLMFTIIPFGFPGMLLGILTMGRSVLQRDLWGKFWGRLLITLVFFLVAPAVAAFWISTFNYGSPLREKEFWEVAERLGLEEQVKQQLRRDKDVRSDY